MAPRAARKSKRAQAPPLEGHSVATSGRFPGTTQTALQERIKQLGGAVASKITDDTTILIATDKEFELQSAKVTSATANNIPIVSIDWLADTESSNVKADENKYLLGSQAASVAAPAPAPGPAIPASAASNGKKRAISPRASPALDQSAPETKKRKKLDENVKVGDGQNAKSAKIVVPIDEYCPSANYEVYIDKDGLIWDASLNQTNASANNNKFYKIQVRAS